MEKKRKTITVYLDEFKILQRAKQDFETIKGGRARWGDFLALLGAGYLVGFGVVELDKMQQKIEVLEKQVDE